MTVLPNEDDNHDRAHKFPFLACEMMKCEVKEILDRFFIEDQEVEM